MGVRATLNELVLIAECHRVCRYKLIQAAALLGARHCGRRAALSFLRSSNGDQNDLAEASLRAGEECQIDSSTHIVVTVQESGKEMQPLARHETYRIGYEAISNACSHSGGRKSRFIPSSAAILD